MPTQTRQRSNIVEGTAAAAFCCGSHGGAARRIALQLPERAVTIHIIRTDDPIGMRRTGTNGSRPSARTVSGSP
jgi:hypothetical protein